MPPMASRARGVVGTAAAVRRQAIQATARISGSSSATAAVGPSRGASQRTRKAPRRKPAAKTVRA